MTQEEFDKAPKAEQILYDCTGMLAKNHPDIIEIMKLYVQSEVEKLNLANIRERFSDIDKIAWEKIEQNYEQEDIYSDDEIMQGEILIASEWYKQGIRDVLNAL